jgi:hypothetical protein
MVFAVYRYCAETLSIHMEDFKTLPTDKLLDLLTEHTSNYLRMVKDGLPDVQYNDTQRVITLLQNEINFRQTSVSTTDFKFKSNNSDEI